MNDSLKMFLIALVTAVASQLLLGPYILKLQGFEPATEVAAPPRVARPETAARPVVTPTPASRLNAPNLEGMTVVAARERWRDKGLAIIEDGEKIDSSAAPGSIIEQRPAAGSPLASMEIRVTVAKATPEVEVPNVVGTMADDARKVLEDAGFEVPEPTSEASREPKGSVIEQRPAAGQRVKAESIVRLVTAESAAVEVPKVTGTRLNKARTILEEAGLEVGGIRRVEHEERGQNYVLRQDPKPGAEVPPSTEIDLVIVAPD